MDDRTCLFYPDATGPLIVRTALLPKGWVVRYLNHSARLILEQEYGEREITVLVSGTQSGMTYAVVVFFEADGELKVTQLADSDYTTFLRRISQVVQRKLASWGAKPRRKR